MKRVLMCAAVVVVLLSLVSCSVETSGRAVVAPVTPVGGDSSPRTSARSPEPTENGSSLDSLDPCGLLTPSALGVLGLSGKARPDRTSLSRSCSWRFEGGTSSTSYTYGVIIFSTLGIDEVVAVGEKKRIMVGSRRAIQSLGAGGRVCAVSIEVTVSSRVDVQATGRSNDGTQLCPEVLRGAELVEPELPR